MGTLRTNADNLKTQLETKRTYGIGVRVWNERHEITMAYNTSIESSDNALS